jgi:hypothetical protein
MLVQNNQGDPKDAKDQLRYSHIIDSLMYLASTSRPDISFVVSKLSRFVSNRGDVHWQALERILHYLKDTASYGIHYSGYPRILEGSSDSNWISDADKTKATSICLHFVVALFPGSLASRPS